MSAVGMSLSRRTRWWLAGLAAIVVVVLAVDAWRARHAPADRAEPAAEGELRPGAAGRAETRRGLNETPLLYSGEFARNVVSRLAPGLVWGEPATGAPSAGLVVSPGYALVSLWSQAPTWMLTTGTGQRVRARLAASDPVHGVALLRIEDTAVPALVAGSTRALQPAEALIVVRPMAGSPGIRTFEWPGTPGAMRELLGSSEHLRVVVALDGTVVGLQLPASAGDRWVDGNEMQRIAAALEREGRHAHPWSGLHVQEVNASLAGRFGPAALVVTHVEPGSPAARAGVKEGTTLSSLERGTDHVTTEAGVRRLLEGLGRVAVLTMDGERYSFDVIDRALAAPDPSSPRPRSRRAPVAATPETRRGVLAPEQGIAVSAEPGSVAATAGLRPGDVVVAVDGAALTTRAALERALASGREVVLKVVRGGEYRYVRLPAVTSSTDDAGRSGGARR